MCIRDRSKGLEFDEVIIPEVDRDTYRTENDRGLLYIALSLIHI